MVIRQVNREYKCVKDNLVMYFAMNISLLNRFDKVSISHIRRVENQEDSDFSQMAPCYKIPKE